MSTVIWFDVFISLNSPTVCLVSPAMVESTAGVAVVRLLSCSSGCTPAVSGLPTESPIVDPSTDPVTYPLMLPGTLPVILCGYPTMHGCYIYGVRVLIRQSVGTSRVFD